MFAPFKLRLPAPTFVRAKEPLTTPLRVISPVVPIDAAAPIVTEPVTTAAVAEELKIAPPDEKPVANTNSPPPKVTVCPLRSIAPLEFA